MAVTVTSTSARGPIGRRRPQPAAPVTEVLASAYTIPTDAPESDGTIAWDSTSLLVVEVRAADHVGLGYSYTDASARLLVSGVLARAVRGLDAMNVPAAWVAMTKAVRN